MNSFLTTIEKRLLESGYNSLSLSEKNELISLIADKKGEMYSQITDGLILEYSKTLKIDYLSEQSDDIILSGFTSSNGHTYRTNHDDQASFIGKTTELLLDAEITTVYWKTEDVGYVAHTREEFIMVFKEGVVHKESNLMKFNTLKGQINNSTTHAEVTAVSWVE